MHAVIITVSRYAVCPAWLRWRAEWNNIVIIIYIYIYILYVKNACAGYSKKLKIEESQQMWAIEGSPGPKAAYRGGGIILTRLYYF